LADATTFTENSPCVNDFIDTLHAFDVARSDPVIFNKTTAQPQGFVFHTIDGHDCPDSPGGEKSWLYMKLAERTQGSKFKLCNTDWTEYFVDIADAVRKSVDTITFDYAVPRDATNPDNFLHGQLPLHTPFDMTYSYVPKEQQGASNAAAGNLTFVQIIDGACPEGDDYTTFRDDFVRSECPSLQQNTTGFFTVDDPENPKVASLCRGSRYLVNALPVHVGNLFFEFKPSGRLVSMSVTGLGAKATAAMIEYGLIEDYRGQKIRPALAATTSAGQSVDDFYKLIPTPESTSGAPPGPTRGTGVSGRFPNSSVLFNATGGKGLALFFFSDAQGKSWFGFQFGGVTYTEEGTATVLSVPGNLQISVILSGTASAQKPGPVWRVQNGDPYSLRNDWNTEAGGFYPANKTSRVDARAMLPSNTSGGMFGPLPPSRFCLDLEIIEYSRNIDRVTLVNFANINGEYSVDITRKNSILLKNFRDVQLRPGFRMCADSCSGEVDATVTLCRAMKDGTERCHTEQDVDTAKKKLVGDYGNLFDNGGSSNSAADTKRNTTNRTGFITGPPGAPVTNDDGNTPTGSDGSGGSGGNADGEGMFSRYAWLWAILVVFFIGVSCCCGIAAMFINSDDDDTRPCFHCVLRVIARIACCHVLEKWAIGNLPPPRKKRQHGAGVEMTGRRGGHHRRHLTEGSNFWTPPLPSERNNGSGVGLRHSRLVMTKDNPDGTTNPLMSLANGTVLPVSKRKFSSAASKNRDNRGKRHAREKSRHIMSPGFASPSARNEIKRFSNFEKFARNRGVKIDIVLCKSVGGTGWALYDSHEHNAEYYHNTSTGVLQWTCPSDVETALRSSGSSASAGAKADPTVGEWIQLFDPEHHPFYCNSKSGRLEWNLPEGARAQRTTATVQKTKVNPLAAAMQMEVETPEVEMGVQLEMDAVVMAHPEVASPDAALGMTGMVEVGVTKRTSMWTEFETDDGLTAYFNEETGESRWTDPAQDDGSAAAADESRPAPKKTNSLFMHSSKLAKLEKQFSEYTTEDGETAYYNDDTGEVSWVNPNAACNDYRPDLTAKQFNTCQCGFPKRLHKNVV
jgi:hypothetical protein